MEQYTLHSAFESQVTAYAHHVAIEQEGRQLTYTQVNIGANKLAWLLKQLGVQRETVVKTFMLSCPELIIAALAIFKAGGIFLPISVSFSKKRLLQIFDQFIPGVLITTPDTACQVKSLLEELGLTVDYLLVMDSYDYFSVWQYEQGTWKVTGINNELLSAGNPPHITEPGDGCYIHYTSGTTGYGKAILGQHKSIHHFITWEKEEFDVTETFRISQLSQVAFDPYLRDVFVPLCAGGTVCIPPEEARDNTAQLAEWLNSSSITLIHIVPTVFRLLTKELQSTPVIAPGFLSELKLVLLAGEIVYARDILNWQQVIQQPVEFVNLYGPSESTLAKAFYRVKEVPANPSQIMHVGKPISNTAIAIFNNNHPCNIGEIGEVYIKTPYLSKGYLNEPEMNAKVFVQNPLVKGRTDIIYKTGDLGRFLPDHSIEIVGRADNQVKINGIRIELGEIEQAVLRNRYVNEAVIQVYKKEDFQDELICYYTGLVSPEDLRIFLQGELNKNIAPSYFLQLDEFPVNINGKVDRKALPKPETFIDNLEYSPPANELEEKLEKVWKEVLDLKKIGRTTSFFKLGGTSTKAIQVVSRIYRDLNVTIKVAEIFSNDTIEKLGVLISTASQKNYSAVQPIEEQEYYAVSHAQKRLWIIHQLPEKQDIYTISASHSLRGNLQTIVFKKAWNAVIARHESLRTVFISVNGEPKQKVLEADNALFNLTCEDVRREHEDDVYAYARACAREELSRPFDLVNGPLVRGKLLKLEEETHVFIFTIHHIISDGWSLEVLMNEIMTLYAGNKDVRESLPPLNIHYKDFTAWQHRQFRRPESKSSEVYWLSQFEGEVPVLNLPADYPRPPVKTYDGENVDFLINPVMHNLLRRYSEKNGVSLFMTLLAAVNALLYRYTGQQDIVIGSPIFGRDREELENQVGFYINTLALRTRFAGTDTFKNLLNKVQQHVLEAFEHKMYPFDGLVDKLNIKRDWSRSPLFDVWVVLQNLNFKGTKIDEMEGLTVNDFNRHVQVSLHDLSFNFYESDSVLATIVYNPRLFHRDTIVRLSNHFLNLLVAILNDSTIALQDINYLAEEDYRSLNAINETNSLPVTEEKILLQLFEEKAQVYADRLAVHDEQATLTYRQLNEKSNALAHYLRNELQGRPQAIVALLLDRSADIIIAMLGVLKAGMAYLPVNTQDPKDRIQYILDDACPEIIITHSRHLSQLEEFTGQVFAMDIQLNSLEAVAQNAGYTVQPNDVAYVIYTSGSTGKPKGSLIEQASLTNLIAGLHETYLTSKENLKIAVVAPYVFDPFGKQVFLALLNGHSLYIVPDELKLSGSRLWEYYTRHAINLTDGTPAHLQILLGTLPASVNDLQHFWIGGAALPAALAEQLFAFYDKHNREVYLLNEYGLTECCVDNTCYLVNKETNSTYTTIPIGKPLPGNQVFILDGNRKPVPKGVMGELYIAGKGLGRGYLNNPELTAQHFITWYTGDGESKVLYKTGDMAKWLPDNLLAYAGRSDDQVKIRGYRVELAEIEARLRKVPGIEDACVIARQGREDKILAGYYTSAKELGASSIKAALARFLPEYMIPGYITWLSKFPLTVNGKIDKRVLPDPQHIGLTGTKEEETPSTALEIQLAVLWKEILDREFIGVNENFFEIGGHSLKAVQIASRIFLDLGIKVEVATLFSNPTIRQLAAVLQTFTTSHYTPVYAIEEQEYYAASHAQKRIWILNDQFSFTIFGAYTLTGSLDTNAFINALEAFVQRHEILRTTLLQLEDEVKQRVHTYDECGFAVSVLDISEETDQENTVLKRVGKERSKRFDLVAGPLVRAELIRIRPARHVFLLSFHHSIADGRSLEVAADEIFHFYDSFVKGKQPGIDQLTVQYKDYSAWHNLQLSNESIQPHKAYWTQKFSDYTATTELPHDFPRPAVKASQGDEYTFELDAEKIAALKKIAVQQNTSLFTLLLTMVKTLLYRYTGNADIIVGTTIANRTEKALENQVGYYIDVLPLRTLFSDNDNFITLLQKVQHTLLEAHEHQLYPFDILVEELRIKRSANRSPLFDVLVQLNNANDSTGNSRRKSAIEVSAFSSGLQEGILDLMFIFNETDTSCSLSIQYDTCLYERKTIQQIGRDIELVLDNVTGTPTEPIQDIRLSASTHEQEAYESFTKI